jgi:monoamine oxidase
MKSQQGRTLPAAPRAALAVTIAVMLFGPAGVLGKMGLQFRPRFWEEDARIFGGITFTNLGITQILYPAEGYRVQMGVLIGYYHFAAAADAYGALTPRQREARALAQGRKGAKIHGADDRQEFRGVFLQLLAQDPP